MNEGFSERTLVIVGLILGAMIGGFLGNLISHDLLGLWTNILGAIGALAGIWAGYKLSQHI